MYIDNHNPISKEERKKKFIVWNGLFISAGMVL